MAGSIRIAICDDNDLSLQGTRATFAADRRFEVVGAYKRLDHRLQSGNRAVDLLILDPFYDRRASLDPGLLARIDAPILIYSEHFEAADFLSLLKAGIAGYLIKSRMLATRLLRAADSLTSDSVLVFDRSIVQYLVKSERIVAFVPHSESIKLTTREAEILDLMCDGLSY